MKTLAEILAAVSLINEQLPGAAQLIVSLKKDDGTTTVLSDLDEADAQNNLNMEEAKAFIAAHTAPKED